MGFHNRRQIRDAIAARLAADPAVVALVGKDRSGTPRIYSGPAPVLREAEDYPCITVAVVSDRNEDEGKAGVQVQRREFVPIVSIVDLADRREVADRLDDVSVEVERALPRVMPNPGEMLGLRLVDWGYVDGNLSSFDGEGSLGVLAMQQLRYRAVALVPDGQPDRTL